MARRSLLAMLRGTDGRSIGRALAVLVLANALLAGLHTGALAGGGTGPGVVCSLAQPSGGTGGAPAVPQRQLPCCLAGCTVTAPALPPVVAVFAPPVFMIVGSTGMIAWAEPVRLAFLVHAARGPPSLA